MKKFSTIFSNKLFSRVASRRADLQRASRCDAAKRGITFILFFFLLPGCIHPRTSAHKPTDIDPKQATADFWYAKPGVATADSPNFSRLWDAAERAARFHRFDLDQNDPRQGVMTTLPLLSQQVWELWRDDLPHLKDQIRSSIAEYRQIIRFVFAKQPDGTYAVTPYVVLERHSQHQHRVTIADRYQDTFLVVPEENEDYSIDQPTIPTDYWYATGRDYALERELAHDIQHRVDRH